MSLFPISFFAAEMVGTYTPKNILITRATGFMASHVRNRTTSTIPSATTSSSPRKKNYDTHVFLEVCKLASVQIKRFIHVSTDEVYNEMDEDALVGNHESCQLLPTNPYSATKAGVEMFVMAYERSYNLPMITIRGNNVYGPNKFHDNLISKFILLGMMGKPLPIHGDGSNVQSYLYCEEVDEGFEVVLHKGEVGHVYNIWKKKERRVLDVVCKLASVQVKRFVHVSADEVYNEMDEDALVGNHEACQLLPTNPYSATKASVDMFVMAYGRSYSFHMITTRGNNVYGPNKFHENLIPKFILLAMMRKPLPIHGDGSNVQNYLYCEDVAEAFEVVLHKGEVGHVYNIRTKKERRVLDVVSEICKLFSLKPDEQIKFVENIPFNDQSITWMIRSLRAWASVKGLREKKG
ncbi:Trifunctional UDP-glucose 4,6-dehydratase/UDP-4-keto-6-deoxy-D-glucose 3,5-epimerase/UDP-4-keto-L-rhamnose-reductase RHM1 [Linum perenne]